MINLRDYQIESVDAVMSSWDRGKKPIVVLPCGAGKSLVIAEIIRRSSSKRVLVLAHSKELLIQNESELKRMMINADTGFFSAGLGRKHYDSQITFANIQSIAKYIHKFDPFDIVCIDEVHRVSPHNHTQYGMALKTLRQMNPDVKLVGLSATPYRQGQGYIHKGEDALFNEIAHEVPIQDLIDQGYLVPVIAKSGDKTADMTGVRKRMGEFADGQMSDRFTEDILGSACDQIIDEGINRRAWIIFCPSVDKAEFVRDRMASLEIDAECVFGNTGKLEREQVVSDFKNGRLKCLINVDTMTTGFNAPICDLVALLRATASPSLYVQIVGRSMRPYEGKENALLLDFGGNVIRNGPIDDVIVKDPVDGGGGVAPAKVCPQCHMIVAASARSCEYCGNQFPEPEPDLDDRPFSGAVLSSQREVELFNIMSTRYVIHKKEGKPDSVRVEYVTGEMVHKEWLCPEHTGYARVRTRKVVKDRYGIDAPGTSVELMATLRGLNINPYQLEAVRHNKFYVVKKVNFTEVSK